MCKIKKAAIFVIVPFLTITVNGETINELKDEYNEMIYEQEAKRTMLEDNYSVQEHIKEQIADLDKRLSEAQVDIDRIDKEVMEIILKIDDAKTKYNEAKMKCERHYEDASQRLRYIYESGNGNNYIEIILNCKDINDFSKYHQYMTDIMEYDAELIEELKNNEQLMAENLNKIKNEEESKAVLEKFRSEREFEMTVMYEERTRLLEEYQNNAEKMEEELNKMQEASDRVAEMIKNMEDNEDFINSYTGGQLEWPVEGRYYVSSGYVGRMSPVGNGYEFHTGIDIPAPEGYEIIASEDGVVINAGWINGYGNTVIINHGGGITTLYAHNSKLLVEEGDEVSRGDEIALCGATGYATGNHCHFEVRINGEHTDPWKYLKKD